MPELSEKGGDPSTARNTARKAPTMKVLPHLHGGLLEAAQRARQRGYQGVIDRCIIPSTHGIRHRATTGMANSGVQTEVGMKLTAHKTVAMFMHYVHTEDKPVRDAAELVANQRLAIAGTSRSMKVTA